MKIPEVFDSRIRAHFHQDTFLLYRTLEDAINDSIDGLEGKKAHVILEFLDEALSGKYSDVDLATIWNRTGAESGGFGIAEEPENGASWLFGKIRDALHAQIASLEKK
ncbi:MAG TPA: hypothetical protein VIF34_03425 [Methylocystis sp.]|jgi:hypothetical protein